MAAVRAVARNPGLRNLQFASVLQTTSRWALIVVLLLVAYQTGGAIAVGLLGAVRTVPALVTIPVAGVIGARRREHVLFVLAAIRALAAISAAVAMVLHVPEALLVVAALDSFAGTLRRPVHAALIPSLAGSPEELVAANVATNFSENAGALLGPVSGGILLAAIGPAGTLLVIALGFSVAAVWIAMVEDVHPGIGTAPADSRFAASAWWRACVAGAQALVVTRGVRLVGALILLDAFVRGAVAASIVIVTVAALGYGGAEVGFLTGMPGLGGLFGVGVALSLLSRRRLGAPLATASVAVGLAVILLGIAPGIGGAAVALVFVGAAGAVAKVAATTLLQRSVPRWDRTRLFGALEGLVEGAVGAGAVVASLAIDAVGVRDATVILGLAVAMVTGAAWAPLRRWEQTTGGPGRELALVGATALFAPLPLDVLDEIAGQLVPMAFPPGGRIITEGEPGDALYLLASGSLVVRQAGIAVATLGPGAAFGEIALLRDVPRTATVEAVEASVALRLDRPAFIAAVSGQSSGLRAAEAVAGAHLIADARRLV